MLHRLFIIITMLMAPPAIASELSLTAEFTQGRYSFHTTLTVADVKIVQEQDGKTTLIGHPESVHYKNLKEQIRGFTKHFQSIDSVYLVEHNEKKRRFAHHIIRNAIYITNDSMDALEFLQQERLLLTERIKALKAEFKLPVFVYGNIGIYGIEDAGLRECVRELWAEHEKNDIESLAKQDKRTHARHVEME